MESIGARTQVFLHLLLDATGHFSELLQTDLPALGEVYLLQHVLIPRAGGADLMRAVPYFILQFDDHALGDTSCVSSIQCHNALFLLNEQIDGTQATLAAVIPRYSQRYRTHIRSNTGTRLSVRRDRVVSGQVFVPGLQLPAPAVPSAFGVGAVPANHFTSPQTPAVINELPDQVVLVLEIVPRATMN